jgi:hypothetical protein
MGSESSLRTGLDGGTGARKYYKERDKRIAMIAKIAGIAKI